MNITKFEEKTAEFLKELDPATEPRFTVEVLSEYKAKYLTFNAIRGVSTIAFKVAAQTHDDLFDKASRILKSYGPKATRERTTKEPEATTEQQPTE